LDLVDLTRAALVLLIELPIFLELVYAVFLADELEETVEVAFLDPLLL
jgi:hypothetical protein